MSASSPCTYKQCDPPRPLQFARHLEKIAHQEFQPIVRLDAFFFASSVRYILNAPQSAPSRRPLNYLSCRCETLVLDSQRPLLPVSPASQASHRSEVDALFACPPWPCSLNRLLEALTKRCHSLERPRLVASKSMRVKVRSR